MSTLLLSDLHLPAQPSRLREQFKALLDGPARNAQAVYLLGDLFEYWVGDDIGLDVYADEIAALARLARSGVALYAMRGNRDFLLGERFERESGVHLLPDPSVARIEGRSWLLSHGDLWCTDDVGYQRWRWFAHRPAVQTAFTHLPRRWREQIAGGLRRGSQQAKAGKSSAIMDVNPSAVIAALRSAGVTQMIHGHTHRPAQHRLEIDGRPGLRIVLPDWHDDRCQVLVMDRDLITTLTLSD